MLISSSYNSEPGRNMFFVWSKNFPSLWLSCHLMADSGTRENKCNFFSTSKHFKNLTMLPYLKAICVIIWSVSNEGGWGSWIQTLRSKLFCSRQDCHLPWLGCHHCIRERDSLLQSNFMNFHTHSWESVQKGEVWALLTSPSFSDETVHHPLPSP